MNRLPRRVVGFCATGALLTGDMLLTAIPPLVMKKGMSLAYVTFSTDLALAEESVRAFHRADVDYEHLLPGHGAPLVGGARRKAMEFLFTDGARAKGATRAA